MHQKHRIVTTFRERVQTNTIITQNDAKRILHQKCRFRTRFRESVITNAVLTQNDAKRILHQNHKDFGIFTKDICASFNFPR